MDLHTLAIEHACDAAATAQSLADDATHPSPREEEGETTLDAVSRLAQASQAWSAASRAWAAIATLEQPDRGPTEVVLRRAQPWPPTPTARLRAEARAGLQVALRSAKTYRDQGARNLAGLAVRLPFIVIPLGLILAFAVRFVPGEGEQGLAYYIAIEMAALAVVGALACRYFAGLVEHQRRHFYEADDSTDF